MSADLDLDAIEARAAAATEGPWSVTGDGLIDGVGKTTGPFGRIFDDLDVRRADAEFIAAAREDVPALVDALRRARDYAVTLERENARLSEQRDAVLALHGPIRLYDPCQHEHAAGEPGTDFERAGKVTTTDCRTPEGVAVGLIDGVVAVARVLRSAPRTPAVVEALRDLRADQDVAALIAPDERSNVTAARGGGSDD
ncbi:MAG: hypothetical protein ACJ74O_13710 [Frankiaceae bacterium]